MKLLVNATSLVTVPTGIGRYTYSIYKCMKKMYPDTGYTFFYDYYYSRELKVNASPLIASLRGKMVHKRGFIVRGARKAKATWTKFSSMFRHFDIYHEPNFVPLDFPASKIVTTVHDLSFMLYPQWHPKERVDFMEKNFLSRIGYSDVILTVSEYGKMEVIKYLGISEDRIRVVPNGVDRRFVPLDKVDVKRYLRDKGYPEYYILFVGAVEPRKNIGMLIDVFAKVFKKIKEFYLIIAGPKGWLYDDVFKKVEDMGLTDRVIFTGFVSDEELVYLYNGASVFVYPSYYEGFGIPVVEAMACGVPVVVSNSSSLPEIVGDAGLIAEPGDLDAFVDAVINVLSDNDFRNELSQRGLARSKQFSWEASARAIMGIFRSLINGGR